MISSSARGDSPAGHVSADSTAKWLDVASGIADHLCRAAYRHRGECRWMGTLQQGGGPWGTPRFTYETLGVDLYGGASGIALFLAEMFACTGTGRYADVAREALRFSAARLDRIPHRFRHGFYSGRAGVAFALARGGALLDDAELTAAADDALRGLAEDTLDDIVLDVISGAAGSIGPLLSLNATSGGGMLIDYARRLGDAIIAGAHQAGTGWSWGDDAIGFHSERPLTGYGHGAGGIGLALLELFDATGDERFCHAGREAFRYENSVFSSAKDNWPDFRYSSDASDNGHFGVAWCLGAPGIALARMRAMHLDPDYPPHRLDAEAAMRTVTRRITQVEDPAAQDFSLCHGFAGLGDVLLVASRVLEDGAHLALAEQLAERGRVSNGGSPDDWRCGLEYGTNPSLMLGQAGIGYFYLRLASGSVQSILVTGQEDR